MILGKKYEIERARLRKAILEDTLVNTTVEATNHACYFCGKKIEEDAIVLIEATEKSQDQYFVHEICFYNAQTNFYINGVNFSLN